MPHRLILLLVAVMILVSEIAVGNTAQKDPRSVDCFSLTFFRPKI